MGAVERPSAPVVRPESIARMSFRPIWIGRIVELRPLKITSPDYSAYLPSKRHQVPSPARPTGKKSVARQYLPAVFSSKFLTLRQEMEVLRCNCFCCKHLQDELLLRLNSPSALGWIANQVKTGLCNCCRSIVIYERDP